MKILVPWLGEYLAGNPPSIGELAERLTFGGLEVEGVEEYGGGLEGIVVVKVESSRRHPSADKLHVCEVFDGERRWTVVCGAPNVRRGIRVPFAPPGVTLPGGLEIGEREVRGVSSSGMLLSASELGLWDDHSGILELGAKAEPGTGLGEHLGVPAQVMEVSATPNRPDALSHLGVARDVAALTGLRLRPPKVSLKESGTFASEVATVRIDDPKRCGRYVGRVIRDVRIGPSPTWLKERLAAAGVRPINNVVDVTNYVLLELGHPLHAFDLDKLAGAGIIVRRAGEGEVLETLDGVSRRLDPDDLVIADASEALALAGVMGGGRSEVTPDTRSILLESAWFEPTGVRRTARRHGLHTESSHRFERGADPMVALFAADRAAALIAKLAGGQVLAGAIDVNPLFAQPGRVELRFARTDSVLGFSIPASEQLAILRRLGFSVLERNRERALIEVPTFRTEMTREIDLIEEVARIFGYQAIPATLPVRPPEPAPIFDCSSNSAVVARLREAAAAGGCREVVNYSFLSEDEVGAVVAAGGAALPEARPLFISNPLSADQAVMRTTVLSSLLANLRHNRRFQRGNLQIYEVGRVYLAGEDGTIHERERFAAILAGRRTRMSWTAGDEDCDFYDAKGLVEAALTRAGIDASSCTFEIDSESLPWLHPRSACRVRGAGGESMGWLGEVHPQVAGRFDVPRGVMALELEIGAIEKAARLLSSYAPVPRYPPILRDLAVVLDESVPASSVQASLEAPLPEAEDAGVRVLAATLFDVYAGPQVGEGRRSLAFAIQYQALDRTLTDAETAQIQQALMRRIERDLGGRLRG